MVPGARDGRAYLLLPAPEAPAGSLHSAGTGPAIAVGRGSVGSETGREPRQTAADYQGRYSGNHGCRPLCAGPGVADDIKTDCEDIYTLSADIFRAFAKSKWVIYEMSLKKGNLEDVFIELTESLPSDSDLDFDEEEDEE